VSALVIGMTSRGCPLSAPSIHLVLRFCLTRVEVEICSSTWALLLRVLYGLARYYLVNFFVTTLACSHCACYTVNLTCEDVLEGQLDVAGIEGRSLDEREVVVACDTPVLARLPGTHHRYRCDTY